MPEHTMSCMEVWGSAGHADNGVIMPGIDAWVFSRPHEGDEQGGDVHYVSSCGTGRISRLLVADIAGHGRSASDLALTLRGLMRRYVNYVDQTSFVERMNREFSAQSRVGVFATAIVATFWAPTGYLVACNAGHPRALLHSPRKNVWRFMEADEIDGAQRRKRREPARGAEGANLPLGVIDDASFVQTAVRLRVGDVAVIYTDSLVEAKLSDGTLLGETGLLGVLRGVPVDPPASFAHRLYDAVLARTGQSQLDDDCTIMVVRANGSSNYGFFQRALGGLKFLGMAINPWRGKDRPLPVPEPRLENILGAMYPRLNKRWGRGAAEI